MRDLVEPTRRPAFGTGRFGMPVHMSIDIPNRVTNYDSNEILMGTKKPGCQQIGLGRVDEPSASPNSIHPSFVLILSSV